AKKESIAIYGDYDVDGICATAILYKAIRHDLGHENTFYFIPDRFEDGYGLATESINKLKSSSKSPLLITVDCGITAVEPCGYALNKGFDVIITDHHQQGEVLPMPTVLVWTDKLCGAGISFALSCELIGGKDEYLGLAALATVADIQPITGLNRSIVRSGLACLVEDPPIGLKKLLELSRLAGKSLTTYDLGWVVTPRLNSAGRLDSALDSLKLLCTDDLNEAFMLAEKLNRLNYERQQKTVEALTHACGNLKSGGNVVVAIDRNYHEGVVGLVAGKLVSIFYKPAMVISAGEEISKGSARSIEGVNITEFLRSFAHLFETLGGHPMAAGFSLKTSKLTELVEAVNKASETFIDEELLEPSLAIDMELPIGVLSDELPRGLKLLEPFGHANPEPVFVTRGLMVKESRLVGSDASHLKLRLFKEGKYLSAIYFGGGKFLGSLNADSYVDLAYNLRENDYNGFRNLDLNVKDFKPFA
ncbi:single-stranded-DNA-specific exonuclease RecJ, partial [candidate division WWE3 bacterium]|nr:single-stranded-DNA-specific exonuclease RecJ [candidate division WWE3 bacterium]